MRSSLIPRRTQPTACPRTNPRIAELMGLLASTKISFPGCESKGQPKDMVPLLAPKEVESLMQPWKERIAIFEAEKF